MTLPDLQFIWFTAFVILLVGYTILDGFDLGVGMLHLFAKEDIERRTMLNTIGPVWDGNEVWLVTAGGALFAGFPIVYATVCSAFYALVMLLLGGLIFRAVAIEFRSKQPMQWWRWMWDALFSFASFIIAMALGMIVGALIQGLPLNAEKEFIGDYTVYLNPYCLLIGVFAVALFNLHGSIYVLMKTEGALHDKMRTRAISAIIFFMLMYAFTTVATLIYQPHMALNLQERPWFFIFAAINILAIANIPREISKGNDGYAFISSCANIACLMALYGVGTYPNAVRASNGPDDLSLTIWNSSSSEKTLEILLLIALIGIPIVISYTFAVYWIFHGKVKLDSNSY